MSQQINPFDLIRQRAGDTQRSIGWYRTQIRALASSSLKPSAILRSSKTLTNNIVPGKMYMFMYDAKHKDKLPYWDKFPLVLPFRLVEGGFYGINLHYLPVPLRLSLLEMLYKNETSTKVNDNKRVQISWDILTSFARFIPIEYCVKQYLFSHVNSSFLTVRYSDWPIAVMLPVEQFVDNSNRPLKYKQLKYR